MYTLTTLFIHFQFACPKKNKIVTVVMLFLLSSDCFPQETRSHIKLLWAKAEVRIQSFCFQKKQNTSPLVSLVTYLIILSHSMNNFMFLSKRSNNGTGLNCRKILVSLILFKCTMLIYYCQTALN